MSQLYFSNCACFLSLRCFCKDCLEILVGPGTFDKLKDIDPWNCYFCDPSKCDGNLKLRPDWSVKVQEFFANNSAMAFVRTTLYSLYVYSSHAGLTDSANNISSGSTSKCIDLSTLMLALFYSISFYVLQ